MSKVKYKFDPKTLTYVRVIDEPKIKIIYFFFTVFAVLSVIGGMNYYFGKEILSSEMSKTLILIFVLTGLIIIILYALLNYLNKWNTNSKSIQLEKSLITLQIKVAELTKNVPKLDNEKIYALLKESLEKKVLQKLEENISDSTSQEKRKKEFFDDLFRSEDRLNSELLSTNRRANLNLIIGILSVVIGLLSFIYIIYKTPDEQGLVVAYFLPRVFLIIFIQLFSYFFLRLYKKGIDDTKYYHNELTNVESKFSAIQYSINIIEEKELNKTIINSMMKNERNSSFSHDSIDNSTETERLSKNESLEDVIDLLKKIVNSEKK
jgi:hypothetical protein